MQLIYLFENSLIMFGPYLVVVLLQLLILVINEDLIAKDINNFIYGGLTIVLYGPYHVYDKYKFRSEELKKGMVFMLCFAVFTTILSYILLKYIKLTLDPTFHIDPDTFWKIMILIIFIIFSFAEEYIWRFHCYDLTYGVFDLHEVRQQHVDLKLPQYGEIYLSLNYGLFYFLCALLFINVYQSLIIGIIFVLVGRTLQYYRTEGIYFCILANLGMKIPLSIIFCMRWFDQEKFNSIFN